MTFLKEFVLCSVCCLYKCWVISVRVIVTGGKWWLLFILSFRRKLHKMSDTDGKKNAEPSQNGTADDLSDLRWMIPGVC